MLLWMGGRFTAIYDYIVRRNRKIMGEILTFVQTGTWKIDSHRSLIEILILITPMDVFNRFNTVRF